MFQNNYFAWKLSLNVFKYEQNTKHYLLYTYYVYVMYW